MSDYSTKAQNCWAVVGSAIVLLVFIGLAVFVVINNGPDWLRDHLGTAPVN